jgi:hypothetical protein
VWVAVLPAGGHLPSRAVQGGRQYAVWYCWCGVCSRAGVHSEQRLLRARERLVWWGVLCECCAMHQQPMRAAGRQCMRADRACVSYRVGMCDEPAAVCRCGRSNINCCRCLLCAGAAALRVQLLCNRICTVLCDCSRRTAVHCCRQYKLRTAPWEDLSCRAAVC